MGLLFGKRSRQREERYFGITSPAELQPMRATGSFAQPMPVIDERTAMMHSAVWACRRLRGNLISTLPVDVYRTVGDIQIDVAKPPILVNPGGDRVDILEWLYSSQGELDSSGNSVGIISQWDGNGFPARIDLQPSAACSARVKDGVLYEWRINGTKYDPSVIWHEKQYTISGVHVGLSPVAYAAWTLGEYASVQQFVTAWFAGNAVPRARLKNVEKKVNAKESTIVKEAWRASQAMGEPFVHGSDWEYSFIQAQEASADWLQAKKFSATDIARFMDVPSDMIDAAVSGESVTYANITQRNLQLLITSLGPAIIRREAALSRLLPRPRFVKLNSDALLRMDPQTRTEMLRLQVESRQLAPSEARALNNMPPFTEEQMAEFDRFWPVKPPKNPKFELSEGSF